MITVLVVVVVDTITNPPAYSSKTTTKMKGRRQISGCLVHRPHSSLMPATHNAFAEVPFLDTCCSALPNAYPSKWKKLLLFHTIGEEKTTEKIATLVTT